jgi:hypothetical protein
LQTQKIVEFLPFISFRSILSFFTFPVAEFFKDSKWNSTQKETALTTDCQPSTRNKWAVEFQNTFLQSSEAFIFSKNSSVPI